MEYQKLCHLDDESAQKIKDLFEEYPDILADSFDDVRPSNVELRHKFELMEEKTIFHKLRGVPLVYNQIVKKEVDRILNAGIIARIESSWTSTVVINQEGW